MASYFFGFSWSVPDFPGISSPFGIGAARGPRRHRIPRASGDGHIQAEDLRVGMELTLYGRVIKVLARGSVRDPKTIKERLTRSRRQPDIFQ